MRLLSLMIVALMLNGQVSACTEKGKDGFLPENDLHIPVSAKLGGLTKNEFDRVIDKLETMYAPVVARMGGKLKVMRLWTTDKVNASAEREEGSNGWIVNMFGGLARHPAVTQDGFSLVLCHEIGHHLGGAPKKLNDFGRVTWASNEGQADYYATLKCLRELFLNDNNAAIVAKLNVPAFLVDSCKKAWPNKADSDICVRSGMAGNSVAEMFTSLDNGMLARFNTPDKRTVLVTDDKHPATQCRLDTFFQGALCEKPLTEGVSQVDEVKGTCHASTGHKVGLRPRCWFRPSR